MKKIVVALLMVFSVAAYGQSTSVKDFRKAQEPDQVFVVYKSTMRMFANMAKNLAEEGEEELPDMQKLVDGMNEIKILMYRGQGNMKSTLATLRKDVTAEGYEEIVSMNLKGNLSVVLQKSKGDVPTDFVLISSNQEGVQVVDVDGAPDLASLEKFVRFMNNNKNASSLMDAFR